MCTVVDIRVDLDWRFVRHPTICYVGPRYWYWRRYDCPSFYISVPRFWCSLYPRDWFYHHFYFGLHRVGVWYERHGFWDPPVRYHGRPGVWDRGGYTGRYPDRPGYGKPPRHDIVNKGPSVSEGRRHYARGDLPSGKVPEIRKPQRLGAPGGENPKARTDPRSGGLKGTERGRVGTRDVDPRVKAGGSPEVPKARISRRGEGGSQKAGPEKLRSKPGDRPTAKGEVRKAKPEAAKSKVKSESKSKAKSEAGKSKAKSGSRSQAKPKAAKSKAKSGSKSKAKSEAGKSKSKAGSKRSR